MVAASSAQLCICAAAGVALLWLGMRTHDNASPGNAQRKARKRKTKAKPSTQDSPIPAHELQALQAFLEQVYALRGWRGSTYHFRSAWASVLADACTEQGGSWQRQFVASELTAERVQALAGLIDRAFFGGKLQGSWLNGSVRQAMLGAAGAQTHTATAARQQPVQQHVRQQQQEQQSPQRQQQLQHDNGRRPPGRQRRRSRSQQAGQGLKQMAMQQLSAEAQGDRHLPRHRGAAKPSAEQLQQQAKVQATHDTSAQQLHNDLPSNEHPQQQQVPTPAAQPAVAPQHGASHTVQQQAPSARAQPSSPQPQQFPQAQQLGPLRYIIAQDTKPSDAWVAYFNESNAIHLNARRWGARQLSRAQPMNCEGVVCVCRLEVLAHTLAHELVHAIVFHVFPHMDVHSHAYLADRRHGPIFQMLNRELFGHASDDFHYVALARRRGAGSGSED